MNDNIIDESSILNIFLMMGIGCNFHCKYCMQKPMEKEKINVENNLQKIYNYIDKLLEKRKDKALKITFFGGEPLLYWDKIKKIVLHYKDKLHYVIISNGSLLNQEKVDFINKYDIHISISHDGSNTIQTRDVDILQSPEILYCLNQINNKHVNAVLSGYNYDFNKIFNYWGQIIHGVNGHIDILRVTWNMSEDLRNIDLDKYRDGLKKFFQDSVEKIQKNIFNAKVLFAIRQIKMFIYSIHNQPYHFPKCYQTEKVLNIDLDGNIYACHNCSVKIGDISEERSIYLQRYYDWLETRKKSECDTCEIRHFCQGGCPLDITNETCILQKILYEEIKNSYKNNKETWNSVKRSLNENN